MERAQKEYYLNEKLQGHSKRARPRRKERNRRVEEKDRRRRYEQGRPRKGRPGTVKRLELMMPPMSARIHRQPQLSRLATGRSLEERAPRKFATSRRREISQRRALRPGKNQRAHPGISCRSPVGEKSERLDSLLRRTSGCRKDFAGDVHRPRYRQEIRARIARRSP